MPKKYEDVLELLGPEPLPGDERELAVLREWTEEFVQERGEDWVKKNRNMFRSQWEYIVFELGVPGIPYP
jgi:hypothetical protein